MNDPILDFYDPLAEHYHLIFEDWDASIERQANILSALLASQLRYGPLKILDCACGIGTQALGFASRGHSVVASDLSPAAVARAKRETKSRGLGISFHVSDITSLAEIEDGEFDVVSALDNALPHLQHEQVATAVRAMASKLKPRGLLLASIRDYDSLIVQGPRFRDPRSMATSAIAELFTRCGIGQTKTGIPFTYTSQCKPTKAGNRTILFRSIAACCATNFRRRSRKRVCTRFDG